MHGNVWQWTGPPNGSVRVGRGGAWNNNGQQSQAAYRGAIRPNDRSNDIGFRLARVPVQ